MFQRATTLACTVSVDATARGDVHARDGADERGLAGTIRAHDRDDVAFRDVERDAIERPRVAMEYIEVLHAQHHSASAPR